MSSGLDTRPNAITFDLEELVEMAWSGKIRIPHFQRAFRWGREDIRRLFDSVLKGYPIGSVLLWLRPAPAQNITLGVLHIDAPETQRALWVVDGQQRITGLANALHPDAANDPRFALGFDLRSGQFVGLRGGSDAAVVPLPALFDLERVVEWFAEHPEVNEYFRAAAAVTKALRQFKIPAYQVEQDDVTVLQDIFDRLNNYGKRLSRAEIFTALTAGAEETADDHLSIPRMAENVEAERAFGTLDEGVVLKAILARRNPDVLRDLRGEFTRASTEFPDEDRDLAFERTQSALLAAVDFLQQNAGVPHVGMLPYGNLLVVLTRFFAHHPEVSEYNRGLLRRWYWRAAVVGPEGFRGGTTGAVRAMCAAVRPGDLSGSLHGLLELVGGGERPLPDLRRFRTNDAKTKIVLCSWWAAGPRSPDTGEVFDAAELAECLVDQWTAASAVRYVMRPVAIEQHRRQWAANRMLVPTMRGGDGELASVLSAALALLDPPVWVAMLDSHAIDPPLVAALLRGDANAFLDGRQERLTSRLVDFLGRMCEWDFEDTPELSELDLDDEDGDDFAA